MALSAEGWCCCSLLAQPPPRASIANSTGQRPFPVRPLARGGRAGEASRFMAALRRAAAREQRDTFDKGELQVSAGAQAMYKPAAPVLCE